MAAQGTAGQADKNRRQAHPTGFSLQGKEDLRYPQAGGTEAGRQDYLRVESSFLPLSAARL